MGLRAEPGTLDKLSEHSTTELHQEPSFNFIFSFHFEIRFYYVANERLEFVIPLPRTPEVAGILSLHYLPWINM